MKTITFNVNEQIARKFEEMALADRQLLEKEFSRIVEGKRSLEEIMREMGEEAQRNGLTEEILEGILKEIDDDRKSRWA